MREITTTVDLKKGLPQLLPLLGELGIVRLMNVRPDEDGLRVEYRPSDINASLLAGAAAAAGWHMQFLLADNDNSGSGSVNNLYVLHNRSGTWALAAKSFEVSQSTTPPSLSLGSQTTVATFTKNGLKPPCVISAEGVHLISDGFTTYELSAIDSIASRTNPADVPGFLCGCYYNGQFVVGNIPTWSTKTGNSQAMIAWSDIGNTNFVANTESVLRTCNTLDVTALSYSDTPLLHSDNTIGFAQLSPTAEIVGMHTMGDKIIVCTTDGLYVMTPVDNTWSITRITRHQCAYSCLGDSAIIFIDKSTNTLYKVSSDLKVVELGYEYIFNAAPNARYQLRYFSSRKAFQIYQFWWDTEDKIVPDWENNFLLTDKGLYQTSYKILIDDHIPKFQKYVTYPDVLRKDTDAFNSHYLVTAPLLSNAGTDAIIGLGPSDFGSSDSTNIRMLKLVGRWDTQKTVGALKGINLMFSNKSDSRYESNVSYAFTAIKSIPVRDMTMYPNVSGKVLYMQINLPVADRLLNEDVVLSGLELSLMLEGAQHRRGRLANTSNT